MKTALRKVLVVEDSPDISMIVKTALEMMGGLEVRACASGTEALAVLDEFTPQLVLLDVMMPEMDGPTVLSRMRDRIGGAAIPVVFLTAKAAPSEVQRLRALGAVAVLTKPFDPLTLHEKVIAAWAAATQ